MIKPLKLLMLLVPALALAGAAGSAAVSSVLAGRLPARAVQAPLVDANAYAQLAIERVASSVGTPAPGGEAAMDALAARAFRSEPTNSSAISALALSRQLASDEAGARILYADALLLSPREKVANLALIEDASARGRIGLIMQRYDVLLRTGGLSSEALFDVMLTALRERAVLPHIESILTGNPPWAQAFWIKAAVNDGAIANVGRLRLKMLAKGQPNPADNDADIVTRLVGTGEFETAFAIFDKVAKGQEPGANILRNAEFDKAPAFPPFDWATYSDARYGAEVDAGSGTMIVFTESSADNLVARQLVSLSAGNYALSAKVRDPRNARGTALTARVRCASTNSAGGDRIASAKLGAQATTIGFAGRCKFAWVELWVRKDTPPSSYATDVAIDSIALVPAIRSPVRATKTQ